uniref:Cell surface glycoprotein MUC18-like n=1 Tax=Poecilia formosa TaxID=48698 RepID=A0A096M1M5_POEFO
MCVSVWGKVELTMNDNLEVYLGDPAEIPCHYSFTGVNEEPSFVIIQWFVVSKRSAGNGSRMRIFYSDINQQIVDNNTDYSGRIEVTSDQRGNTLLIHNVQLSDEKEFFCQVNGQEAGNAERKTHLRVFAPPEAPEIEGVPNGISVTNTMPSKVASCEVRNGFPKPNITWYKDNEPLMPQVGQVNVIILVTREPRGFYSVQSTLEYRILKEDKDSHFSCEVSFSVPGAIRTRMSQSINVTVHYPTAMMELWKDSPQGLVKEGDTVELRCQGDGNPPPIFIFSKEQSNSAVSEEPDTLLESRGDVLILPSVSRKDSGIYQCRVLDSAGQTEIKEEVTLTVHYLDPAVVVPKELEYMDKGENLVASCNALSSLKTVTMWYKLEGKQVGHGNTLHLNDATYETSGRYVCEVTVPSLPSLHTNGSVNIIVQGGPQLAGVEDEVQLEEVAGRTLNLSCEARGHPLPSITWSITGSQNWQEVMSKANDHITHSMVSVKINSDVSAICNASNNQGTEVEQHVFLIQHDPVEGSGVIIVVIILCLLLLAFLGSIVYFLHKKGKIPCGRSGKQEITKEKPTKDDIVVEMKNNPKNEDAVLLKAVNGEKKGPNDQMDDFSTLEN